MVSLHKSRMGETVRIIGFESLGEITRTAYLNDRNLPWNTDRNRTFVDVTYVEFGRTFTQPCFADSLLPA